MEVYEILSVDPEEKIRVNDFPDMVERKLQGIVSVIIGAQKGVFLL